MQILRDEASIAQLKDPDLRALIQQRTEALLHEFDDMALHELVTFVVVEPGDSLQDLEGQLGLLVLGLPPRPELIEEHAGYFELVFVISDDGFGIEVFIPKNPGIDPELFTTFTTFTTFPAFGPSTSEKLMNPACSAIADLVALLDENLREAFEERAGIIEFDANKPRDLAECLALLDVLRRHPGALLGVTALQVDLDFVLTTTPDVPPGAIPVADLAGVINERFGGTAQLSAPYMKGP